MLPMPRSCPFYTKSCLLECQECRIFVCCARCHLSSLEAQNHTPMDDVHCKISAGTKLQCQRCSNEQTIADTHGSNICCLKCRQKFGSYMCLVCGVVLFPSPNLKVWHCNQCRCCRQGSRYVEFEHCSRCELCIRKDLNHQCFDITSCCVCLMPFNSSYGKVVQFSCSHQIHEGCMRGIFTCPICRKNIMEIVSAETISKSSIHTRSSIKIHPAFWWILASPILLALTYCGISMWKWFTMEGKDIRDSLPISFSNISK